jgi:hypothetical protein
MLCGAAFVSVVLPAPRSAVAANGSPVTKARTIAVFRGVGIPIKQSLVGGGGVPDEFLGLPSATLHYGVLVEVYRNEATAARAMSSEDRRWRREGLIVRRTRNVIVLVEAVGKRHGLPDAVAIALVRLADG